MLSLCDVVAVVESNRFAGAMRFESALFDRTAPPHLTAAQSDALAQIRHYNYCTLDTARAIFATSFGRFQFLGATLYSPPVNLKAAISVFWTSDALQLAAFNAFVKARGVDCSVNDLLADPKYSRAFALAYNGPGAVDAYAGKLIAAAKLLNGTSRQPQEVAAE
jgi:hypothetical protein